jgi:sulfide:quinone oxidoreductase
MFAVPTHPRVVIAGAGVGGLEAALAIRALAGPAVAIELIAPETAFVYRALTVAEPFGYRRALRVPLAWMEATHGVVHRRDRVVAVHPKLREVELDDGERLAYDVLVVAVGARPEAWLPGAVSFAGATAVPHVREVLDQLAAGTVERIAFATPDAGWTLPAYELALLTAGWCSDHGITGAELSVLTPEREPLEAFGRAAAHTVRDLLGDRGIAFHGGHVPATADDVDADTVVALPALRRTPVPGLPADERGFLPVDEYARVVGVPHVFGVGDATDQPIKQGGLATQQADAAASVIAHDLGAPVEPEPFRAVLRGLLLGGMSPAFLRRDERGGVAAFDALWWPPTKVAGRRLGPYLADMAAIGEREPLDDRPAPEDAAQAARDREELRRLAEQFARAEAGWGDHRSALRWLQTLEWLDGVLAPELEALRDECLRTA